MEFLPEIMLAVSVAGVLVAADRSGGGRRLLLSAIAGVVLLGVVFWWRWATTPKVETPLIAHVLAAAMPVSCTAMVVFRSRGWDPFVRVGVGAALYFLLLFGSVLLGTYVLGDIIPLSR